MKPKINEPAPHFSALAIGGDYKEETRVSLNEFKGKRVVLIFYPKDNTPGCTTQACEVRDNWESLKDKAHIFGVSRDAIISHQKFIYDQKLPYALISDESGSITESYGVWVEKSLYGKKYKGIERSTFIIDAKGSLEKVLEKVAPKEHLKKLSDHLL